MKLTMMTSAFAIMLASSVSAKVFNSSAFSLELYSGNTIITLDTVGNGVEALSFGVYVLPHEVLGGSADVLFTARYNFPADSTTLSVEYGAEWGVSYNMVAYVSAEAAYTFGPARDTWEVTPLIGASYTITPSLAAFAEVSYAWDASRDWTGVGGMAEIGLDYEIGNGVFVRPSLTRTFDTGAVETNVKMVLSIPF
jgi:hypothetical protein